MADEIRIARDVDCPSCGHPETYGRGTNEITHLGCNKCGWETWIDPEPKVGSTCRIGKGKTLWEIVEVEGEEVQLSALGRGGFVNRSAKTNEVTDIQPGRMQFPLALVLSRREAARSAAHALWDRLRFSDPGSVLRLADEADAAARSYALTCGGHSEELVDLNIKEG